MSQKESQQSASIHAVGVDDRGRYALQFFFEHNCRKRCSMVEEDAAEIFLVDMDGYGASPRYEALRSKYPGHPMITMSLSPERAAGDYFLQKPIQLKQLETVIEKIAGSRLVAAAQKAPPPISPAEQPRAARSVGYAAQLLSEQEILSFVGSGEDIDPNDPEKLAKIYFDPDSVLLGKLRAVWQQAQDQKAVLRLAGVWQPITLFPATGQVHLDLSDRQLQSICVVAVDASSGGIHTADIKTEKVKDAEANTLIEQGSLQDMEQLLWKIALWTSRGRIPNSIQLDKPVYLRAWPNFTRLIVTPHALRIAACLLRQPRSLLDLAKVLQIPQRYVFSFFTAANLTGLAGQSERSADVIVEPVKIERTVKSRLLSRILKSLTRTDRESRSDP